MVDKELELQDKIQVANLFSRFRKKIPLLIFIIFIGVVVGFLVGRYKKPIYMAKSVVNIEDSQSDVSDFLSIDMFTSSFNQYNTVLTESKIISSRTMIERALEALNLEVRYYKYGSIAEYELYKKSPIKLNLLSGNIEELYPLILSVEFKDSKNFDVSYDLKQEDEIVSIEESVAIDKEFNINNCTFSITLADGENVRELETYGGYSIKFAAKEYLASQFSKELQVLQPEDKVTLLNITFKSSNPMLSEDFVEALTNAYVNYEYEVKRKSARNTIKFIDARLGELTESLEDVENRLAQFKQDKKIIDFESSEKIETEKYIELESNRRLLELRLVNLSVIESKLNESRETIYDVNINAEGSQDPTLNHLITNLNMLKLEKATLELNFTKDSRKAKEIESQIKEIVLAIKESITISRNSVNKEILYLSNQLDVLNERFDIVPENQKDFFNITRDFEVNQKVTAFLMEKKIEASIMNASLLPGVEVIDYPIVPLEPISISRLNILILSFLISSLLGASFVFLLVFFDNKIYQREDVEHITKIPLLGSLTNSKSEKYSVDHVFDMNRTIFKESLNSLRTSIRFLPNSTDLKTIGITSTVSQEGKSFTLINLAASLTLLGKKVVVVDLDMRKPKIHRYFDLNHNKNGASLFLSGKSSVESIVSKTKYENLDVVMSGPIPPNPIELVQSDELKQMVTYLKNSYDYVLLDNPPIGIVADSLSVLRVCDLNLYVIRSNFSKIDFIQTAELLLKENKKKLYIILNDSEKYRRSKYYSYSQGYYTDVESSSWLKSTYEKFRARKG